MVAGLGEVIKSTTLAEKIDEQVCFCLNWREQKVFVETITEIGDYVVILGKGSKDNDKGNILEDSNADMLANLARSLLAGEDQDPFVYLDVVKVVSDFKHVEVPVVAEN